MRQDKDIVPDAVILANGEFPKGKEPLFWLHNSRRLVCCDGAANIAITKGFEPDLIVGDLDSISQKIKDQYSDRLVHVAEQESNDLTKAFRYCLSQNWKRIVIIGATGKREDHTLGNISLLLDFAYEAKDVSMVTDTGFFRIARESGSFHAVKGQQISIFSFNPRQEIISHGLKYPLNRMSLPKWNMGTLNEATEEMFTLEFSPESPLLLFFANPDLH